MYQKRGDRTRSYFKKAQITIFITAGLVIFLIFILLFQLAADIQRRQLSLDQKDIFDKIFTKDAIRLFVDECLREGMEEGLTLIGRQGRLWTDQPGGRVLFEEGKTGAEAEGDRIFYALKDEKYVNFQNAFPCNDDRDPTAFCQYSFPNTNVGFGEIKLDRRFIAADLQRYLKDYSTKCVEEFVRSEIRDAARVETSPDMNLAVSLQSDVIRVKVHYPIKLQAGKEEFFHITNFDFTYPSQFSQLVDSVVVFSIEQDQKYLDFNLNQETLTQPTFNFKSEIITPGFCSEDGTCIQNTRASQHAALLTRTEIKEVSTGDDLFEFVVPRANIIPGTSGDFVFRVLRENRPPALDYVGRLECPAAGYDYLVIKGSTINGDIDIQLSAKDADEDSGDITYSFSQITSPSSLPHLPLDGSQYVLDGETIKSSSIQSGSYTLKSTASDNNRFNNQEDWQDVKIFIDEPLTTGIVLDSHPDYDPSKFGIGGTGPVNFDTEKGVYIVSREDPYLLSVDYPSASANLNRNKFITLKYSSTRGNKFGFEFSPGQTTDCFVLPVSKDQGRDSTLVGCASADPSLTSLNYYDSNLVSSWNFEDQLQSPLGFYRTESGKFSLSATGNYCQENTIFSVSEAKVEIKGCYPHKNPNHPFAYPDHEILVDPNNRGVIETEPINPLLAEHVCCSGDPAYPSTWGIKAEGTTCFENPIKGCYGGVRNFPGFISGYIVTEQVKVCDGLRGNACLGGTEAKLPEGPMHCGTRSDAFCSDNIHQYCENENSFSFVDSNEDGTNDGWCSGRMGCQNFCTGSGGVVFRQAPANAAFRRGPGPRRDFSSDYINQQATNNKVTDENNQLFRNSFLFKCGCGSNSESDDGKFCDSNYDGYFDGTCSGRICQPPAAPRPPPPSQPLLKCTVDDFTFTEYEPAVCPPASKRTRSGTLNPNANCVNPDAVELNLIQTCIYQSIECQIDQKPLVDNCECLDPNEVDDNGVCKTRECNPGERADNCRCVSPNQIHPDTKQCILLDPMSSDNKP